MNRLDDPQDDAVLRALYGEAQARISPATTARLHRARHAATQETERPRRAWGVPLATGLAAVCALAVGVGTLWPVDAPDAPAGTLPALAAVDSATQLDDGLDEALAGYEESPDFYRWLAANETALFAVE